MAKNKKKKNREFNPDVDTGILRPVYATVAAGDLNDRYSDYPSKGLTPRRLAKILREADDGNVRSQMELFEEMEEKDAHLFSQLQTRKLAVTGLPWEIQPYSQEPQDEVIADFIREQFQNIENFDDVLIDLMDAVGKGISIMELVWGVNRQGRNVVDDILYVHPKKLMWSWEEEQMMICTEQFPSGIELPENKFIVHNYKAKSGHPARSGIMRIVSWMYLFKNYTVKDWVSFCEVYGMPLRLGKYDQAASEEDKQELLNAIIRIGSDAAGIIPDTTMIEFKESNKTTSSDIYENMARYCDEQTSKAILGQTLTSDSGGGSYAQAKTHDKVRHDLTVADAKALAVTLRRDLIRPLVEYNFGTEANLPFIIFAADEEEDQKEKADVLNTLAAMGLQIPTSYLYKTFNVPKPDEGDEILNRPQGNPNWNTQQPQLKDVALKAGGDGQKVQKELDGIVELAVKQMADIAGHMVQPLIETVKNWDGTLEELADKLKDERELEKLYDEIDSQELQDLLYQAGYLGRLIGRTQE